MSTLAAIQKRAHTALALGNHVEQALTSLRSAELAALALGDNPQQMASIKRARKELCRLLGYSNRVLCRQARKTDKAHQPQGQQ